MRTHTWACTDTHTWACTDTQAQQEWHPNRTGFTYSLVTAYANLQSCEKAVQLYHFEQCAYSLTTAMTTASHNTMPLIARVEWTFAAAAP